MGDLPPGSAAQSLDTSAAGIAHGEHKSNPISSSLRSPSNDAPFYSQLSSIPQGQIRSDLRSPLHPASPQYSAQDHGAMPLNMGSMAGALPEYGSVDAVQGNAPMSQPGQRPLSGASTSALVYQLQQNLQLPNHVSGSVPSHQPYGSGFAVGQYHQNFMSHPGAQHAAYPTFTANQPRMPAPNSMQPPYQGFQQPSQYMYYPSPYGPHSQFPQGYPMQGTHNQPPFGRRASLPGAPVLQGQTVNPDGHFPPGGRGAMGEPGMVGSVFSAPYGQGPGAHRQGLTSSIPRGPPRKPKQSGHALWVGNLPPGTTVIALKDHFSKEATKEIESLFLISKSNCAFVNYRTEASCTAAMHRFHDSRFNGVRLVCRLRRSSAPASGVPTGPSAMVGNPHSNASVPTSPENTEGEDSQAKNTDSPASKDGEETKETSTSSEKYFVVKSLTLQDLELSLRNGIWATQSHNEESLNKAYQSAQNVYLIFSANKSGEYFGYARMASPILEETEPLIESAPKPENILEATDVPKSIPTPATEFAPKGRIIDDSARGTIFWEAELPEPENEEEATEREDAQAENDSSIVAQSWGKPFKIEWISTNRLPFYRTRGLRNPWNANREVKIARDGTELEPSVGERLVQMFHRLGPSNTAAPPPMMQQPSPLGAPQMRPY